MPTKKGWKEIVQTTLIAWLTCVSSAIGAFFGSYFKKRGETSAIQDDLKKPGIIKAELTSAVKKVRQRSNSRISWRGEKFSSKKEALDSFIDLLHKSKQSIVELKFDVAMIDHRKCCAI